MFKCVKDSLHQRRMKEAEETLEEEDRTIDHKENLIR